ncbi:MAG: hypothetical protein QOD51_777 [Candidatus Eremiobacteraeota bacterium]|nr:hypothetical protein [Candidatus Eremiobacteraeota bacterium]
MKVLLTIAALLLTTAISRTVYNQDRAHISPTDRAPRMAFRWWKAASEGERLAAVATAIQGLRAGWTFGLNAQLGSVSANLNEAYAEHKVSADAIEIATRPRPVTPPVFTKPLSVYRSKVDNAYARVPSMREQDVALVLLCFSDLKIIDCRDANGKPLR